eukprot:CAMPEP_0178407878 /NCGR_PEP_ID=MMETSP0689_2-20121128/19653_1 /TAXON_ID=160604 /ORGANISM="Amphidinium massartii, Strain CS-259" /LENGTH=52 /DNA_ID=CAMNT_0020028961 /DNA_START=351 /DNA_END=509 /DNA_ORIENTATION=+
MIMHDNTMRFWDSSDIAANGFCLMARRSHSDHMAPPQAAASEALEQAPLPMP